MLDYFFKDIYREGDRVILADQRRSLEINNAVGKENTVDEFKSGMADAEPRPCAGTRKDSRCRSNLTCRIISTARKCNARQGPPPGATRIQWSSRYEQLLREYRLQNQKPNVDRLEAMSRALEAVDADKWALVFFQHDSLPLFDVEKMKLATTISSGGGAG